LSHDIVKRYGKNSVLNQLLFKIEDAQLTTIPGPSGCGKSTMLRCLNRLESFDQGQLRIGDVQVAGTEEKTLTAAQEKELTKRLRASVGIVFQTSICFRTSPFWITARAGRLSLRVRIAERRKISRVTISIRLAQREDRFLSGTAFGRAAAACRNCASTDDGTGSSPFRRADLGA